MASPTEEEVNQQREKVAELRKQVAESEASAAAEVAGRTRANDLGMLKSEEARLQARLGSRPQASATPAPRRPTVGDDNKE